MDKAFLDLMEEVERKRAEIRCSKSGAFYRGHSNGKYQLIPSLLRNPGTPGTEHNLYHECFARANHLMANESTSWQRLAFFQHYGIPTRLLDWTESLGVALFFAVQDNPQKPHIWIINAFMLNKGNKVSAEPRILMPGLDVLPDYYDCFVRVDKPSPWPHNLPLFMQIPWTTERLRAQSGFFTFHPGPEEMEKVSSDYARRVEIPDDAIPGVQRFLELAGISEYTVFPDFVGLADFLRRRYRL
ncbi:MAG: FRG domain-containing protein [Isosphaeraceae bacterium]